MTGSEEVLGEAWSLHVPLDFLGLVSFHNPKTSMFYVKLLPLAGCDRVNYMCVGPMCIKQVKKPDE